MATGQETRRNKEALEILADRRGAAGDAAQRKKEVRDLQLLIADLRKKADKINADIAAADEQVDDLIAQLADVEADIPLIVEAVGDIQDALTGGTDGQFYSKGAAALGGDWLNVVGPLSGNAIVEYGGNADGSFVRLRGGLLICLSPTFTLSVDAATVAADIYQSAEQVWTFPRAFNAQPCVSPCTTTDHRAWVAPYDAVTTQVCARMKAHASIAGTVNFRLKAEGYW